MSKNFNQLERALARMLSSSPKLKLLIKKRYSEIMYLINKPKDKIITNNEVVIFGDKNESFYGYYDKSPMNKNGFVICQTTDDSTTLSPDNYSELYISIFHISEPNKALHTLVTKAFNWQQGARAQWLDDFSFIYNDIDSGKYVSKIFSIIDSKVVKTYNLPVQDAFENKFFLSLNYERLRALRPDYGYHAKEKLSKEFMKNNENSDGIYYFDLISNNDFCMYTIKDICELEYKDEYLDADHKINHMMISPNGENFIFLHRYFINGIKKDRLILSSIIDKKLKVLSSNGMVSHCYWMNDKEIISYMRGNDGHDGYYIINIDTGNIINFLSSSLDINGDGHPNVRNDNIIIDSYPDKSRMQKLYLINNKSKDVKIIGQFRHGFNYYGESRCDLHPRISSCGKYVFFDSVFSGKRKLCVMEL